MLFVVGIQLIGMGLLAELLVRTYHESQQKAVYLIAEEVNAPVPNRARWRARSCPCPVAAERAARATDAAFARRASARRRSCRTPRLVAEHLARVRVRGRGLSRSAPAQAIGRAGGGVRGAGGGVGGAIWLARRRWRAAAASAWSALRFAA